MPLNCYSVDVNNFFLLIYDYYKSKSDENFLIY